MLTKTLGIIIVVGGHGEIVIDLNYGQIITKPGILQTPERQVL